MGKIMNNEKRICLNQSVLDFMDRKITHSSVVLEVGSGWSSRWFATRCGQLVTVEADLAWFLRVERDLVRSGMNNWAVIRALEPTDSLGQAGDQADLVLVDCREDLRYVATQLAWSYLKAGGWLVFDDAQRPRHFGSTKWLSDRAGVPTRLEWAPADIPITRFLGQSPAGLAFAWQKPAGTAVLV